MKNAHGLTITADIDHIAPGLRHLAFPLDQLKPDPTNARLHSRRNSDATEISLKRYGQRKPLIARRDSRIVQAGNLRLEVMLDRLGWTHAAVLFTDDNDADATAFALGDNRAPELAEWNTDALQDQLQRLGSGGVDLSSVGWTTPEVEGLTARGWSPPPALGTLGDFTHDTKPERARFTIDEWKAIAPILERAALERGLSDADALAELCTWYLDQ